MPVVVTGAAGFLGGMLTSALAGDGERVVAVDRRPVPVSHPGVTVLRADLLDRDSAVSDALRAADAVFHLAGWPGVRETGARAEYCGYRDNVLATRVVLAEVPARTPLVVVSSAAVYGGATGRPCREDDPVRPLGSYGRSMVQVERMCAERFAAGGALSVARPFTVVGEGQRPDMAVARWIEAVRTGGPVLVFGSPWRTRDVVDVRDVVRSLRAMAERGVAGLLNIGSGQARSLADLITSVGRAVGAVPDVHVQSADPAEPAATRADTTRHEQLLGFRPLTDLDTLVRRQVAAGLASERITIARAAAFRRDHTGRPTRTAATVQPLFIEPVFLENVLVATEQDRVDLAYALGADDATEADLIAADSAGRSGGSADPVRHAPTATAFAMP